MVIAMEIRIRMPKQEGRSGPPELPDFHARFPFPLPSSGGLVVSWSVQDQGHLMEGCL